MMLRTRADAYRLADLVGGLSRPSKMPCHSYSLPARACVTGAKLAAIEGTTCASCYAMKGRYRFANVQAALERRLAAIARDDWADVMAAAVGFLEDPERGGSGFFRWHDSGDLQGVDHLRKVVDVAYRTPHVRHWLPTREGSLVRAWGTTVGCWPANLNVRVSLEGHWGGAWLAAHGFTGSRVGEWGDCPAPEQGNVCGDCRRCWDRDVGLVTYARH